MLGSSQKWWIFIQGGDLAVTRIARPPATKRLHTGCRRGSHPGQTCETYLKRACPRLTRHVQEVTVWGFPNGCMRLCTSMIRVVEKTSLRALVVVMPSHCIVSRGKVSKVLVGNSLKTKVAAVEVKLVPLSTILNA